MVRQPYLLFPPTTAQWMQQQFGGTVQPPARKGRLYSWYPPADVKVYEAAMESSHHHFKITEVVRLPNDQEWVVVHLWVEGVPDLWRVYDPQGRIRHEENYTL